MSSDQNNAKESLPAPPAPWCRFSLAELFGLVTASAFALAGWGAHPTLGIFSLLVIPPAYVRTLFVIRQRKMFGLKTTWSYQLTEFFGACLFMATALYVYLMLLVLVLLSFFSVAHAFSILQALPPWFWFMALGIAALAGLYLPYAFLRSLWKLELHSPQGELL